MMNFFILLLIYAFVFYPLWKEKTTFQFFLHTFMYIYITLVLFVTLMPFPLPLGNTNNLFLESANFIPFRDLYFGYGDAKKEMTLNIFMMIPFGFLYPLLTNKKLTTTVCTAFLFSFTIELLQLIGVWWGNHARSFDVTDLITNTTGGLLGYLLYLFIKTLTNRL